MNKCVVFYEDWQMECCGKKFSVNTNIKWLVCNGDMIKLPIKTDKIDYYYEAHSSDYKKLFILEGKVKEIKSFYQKYEKSKNSNILVGVDGTLYNIDSSNNIEDKKDEMKFSGYLVYIEDYTIRPAQKNEVSFE